MKDYSAIEQRLQRNYDGLVSAVKEPAYKIDTNAKIKSKRQSVSDFFQRPGMQAVAAALAVVFTVGGFYAFIFFFGGRNTGKNPDPLTSDTVTDQTETAQTDNEVTDDSTDAETTDTRSDVMRIIAETDRGALFAGENAFVHIKLENVKELASLALTVTWDERLTLDLADYAKLSGLKNLPDNDDWSTIGNSFTFNWVALEPENAISGDFTFVTLVFITPDESGTYPLTITANKENIFDSNDQNVPFTIINTEINTVEHEPTAVPDETTAKDTEPAVTDTDPVITETDPLITETDPLITETDPVTTAPDPSPEGISKYLHFSIVDPAEDESGLTQQQFGKEKFAILEKIDECEFESVTIPDTYKGYPVKMFFGLTVKFSNIKGLKYAYLPDSVTWMEIGTFMGCTDIIEVKLPANLKEIPDNTFWCCKTLEKVIMPSSLKSIGKEAFFECTSLRLNSFPASLETISSSAFAYCTKLSSIDFGNVKSIGDGAFRSCVNITKITFSNALTEIGSGCFANTSVREAVIPSEVKYLSKTFSGCSALQSVTLNEGLLSIGNETFSGCKRLTELHIPDSVTSLGSRVFVECGIKELYISKYVTEFNSKAFEGFAGKVTIDEESEYYIAESGQITKKPVVVQDDKTDVRAAMGNINLAIYDLNKDDLAACFSDEYRKSIGIEDVSGMTFEEVCLHIPYFKTLVEHGSAASDLFVYTTHTNETSVTLSDGNTKAEYNGVVSTQDYRLSYYLFCIFSLEKTDGVWLITNIELNPNGMNTVFHD